MSNATARVELIRLRALNRQRVDRLLALVRAEFKSHTTQAQKRLTMVEVRETTTDEQPSLVLAEIRRLAKHLSQLQTWADDQIGELKQKRDDAVRELDGAIFDEQLDLFEASHEAAEIMAEPEPIAVTLDPTSGEMAIQVTGEPATGTGGKRSRRA